MQPFESTPPPSDSGDVLATDLNTEACESSNYYLSAENYAAMDELTRILMFDAPPAGSSGQIIAAEGSEFDLGCVNNTGFLDPDILAEPPFCYPSGLETNERLTTIEKRYTLPYRCD